MNSKPSELFHLRRTPRELSKNEVSLRQLIAGGLAGCVTKTSTAPLERIKILLQVEGMQGPGVAPRYTGMINTGLTVLKDDGVWALWRGNGANCLRVVPVYGLKFALNDRLRDIVKKPGQTDKDLTTIQLAACGTFAGFVQQCCTFPLELTRTRLSLQSKASANRYKGIADVLVRTVREEGFPSLYKGLGPTILSGAPYVGLQMTFYELWKRQLTAEDGSMCVFRKLVAGSMAGLTAQMITYPGDTIRRRMIANGMGGKERTYKNSMHCCKLILQHEGFKGFFKGFQANCVRAIPGASIQFWAYDFFKGICVPEEYLKR